MYVGPDTLQRILNQNYTFSQHDTCVIMGAEFRQWTDELTICQSTIRVSCPDLTTGWGEELDEEANFRWCMRDCVLPSQFPPMTGDVST